MDMVVSPGKLWNQLIANEVHVGALAVYIWSPWGHGNGSEKEKKKKSQHVNNTFLMLTPPHIHTRTIWFVMGLQQVKWRWGLRKGASTAVPEPDQRSSPPPGLEALWRTETTSVPGFDLGDKGGDELAEMYHFQRKGFLLKQPSKLEQKTNTINRGFWKSGHKLRPPLGQKLHKFSDLSLCSNSLSLSTLLCVEVRRLPNGWFLSGWYQEAAGDRTAIGISIRIGKGWYSKVLMCPW